MWMFYKPSGVDTDMSPGSDLSRFIPMDHQFIGIHHIGRLDRDTSGLLLLSSDGVITHSVLNSKGLIKTYLACVGGEVTGERLYDLSRGVDLSDGPATVVSVEKVWTEDACIRALYLRPDYRGVTRCSYIRVKTCEGRNRIVRRMLASVGLPVLSLHREQIGPLALDKSDIPGFLRPLTEAEITALLSEL